MSDSNPKKGTSSGRCYLRKQQPSSTTSPSFSTIPLLSSTIPPPSSIIPPSIIHMAPSWTPPLSMPGVYSPLPAGSPPSAMYSSSFYFGPPILLAIPIIYLAALLIHPRLPTVYSGSPTVHSGSSTIHLASPSIHPTNLKLAILRMLQGYLQPMACRCYILMEIDT